jgi:hypothetical protein
MVLDLVQEHYGMWNTAESVFTSDQGEAIIFVMDADGESPICVNLPCVRQPMPTVFLVLNS